MLSSGVERAGEAAAPKGPTIAFDGVASRTASGHERHEGLIVKEDRNLLANLHDGR